MIFRSCNAEAAKGLRSFLLPPPIRSQILLSASRSSYSLQTYNYQHSRLSSSFSSTAPSKRGSKKDTSPRTPTEKEQGLFEFASEAIRDAREHVSHLQATSTTRKKGQSRFAFAIQETKTLNEKYAQRQSLDRPIPKKGINTASQALKAGRPDRQQTRLSSTTSKAAVKGDRINASSTTLPAALDVPSRGKDQGTLSYALQAGKVYLGFYKTGIKNIWYNYKTAKELKHRLNSTQTPQLPPGPDAKTQKNVFAKYVLTRAELQFLRRSQHDINRVPIFALLFAIVGEWLPLIVIFFTPIVPYTCRIPRQVEKTRRVLEETRRKSFRGELDGYIPTMKLQSKNGGETVRSIEDLEKGQLMHISRSLGLHSRLWDFTKGLMPGSGILKYRVRKHLEYLEKDDALLVRDGGVKGLNKEEVLLACEQRGIDILGRKEDYLKDVLERWIKGRREGMVLGMLLSRP